MVAGVLAMLLVQPIEMRFSGTLAATTTAEMTRDEEETSIRQFLWIKCEIK